MSFSGSRPTSPDLSGIANGSLGNTPPVGGSLSPDIVKQMWAAMVDIMAHNGTQPSAPAARAPVFPAFVSSDISPAGKSIPNLFPSIETSMLLEIARHEFRPIDLCKLDSRFRNKADVERMDSLAPRAGSYKEYPSLHSLIIPLQKYFQVLQAFSMTGGDAHATFIIGRAAGEYVAHIMDLNQLYDWNAVLQYHMQFHLHRRQEMRSGSYAGWAVPDTLLMSQYLISHPRAAPSASRAAKPRKEGSSEICFSFNKGFCTTTPCPAGRLHKCKKCGGADHPEKTCKST